jgi:type II secretory pathway component PulJ
MFSHNPEERIKRLEEEVAYLHRDMANLIAIIENTKPKPETHYHFLIDSRTCKDCNTPNSTDLNEYI